MEYITIKVKEGSLVVTPSDIYGNSYSINAVYRDNTKRDLEDAVKFSLPKGVLEIELTKEGLIDLIKQHFGELYGTNVVTVNIDHNLKTKIKING